MSGSTSFDGVSTARFALDDSAVITADAIGGEIRLRGMFDNACIPNMGSTEIFYFIERLWRERIHCATAVDGP